MASALQGVPPVEANAAITVLVGGGVRSGKSAFALSRAMELGERRTFIATAEPLDDEMRARAAHHQRERGEAFATVEEPVRLPEAIEGLQATDVVVVDCLTLWLSNLLVRDLSDARIEGRIDALVAAIQQAPQHVVLVTNEVGMGIVPEALLARRFRDLTGRAHRLLGACADELYIGVLGTLLRVRPNPVELVVPPPAHASPPARDLA